MDAHIRHVVPLMSTTYYFNVLDVLIITVIKVSSANNILFQGYYTDYTKIS